MNVTITQEVSRQLMDVLPELQKTIRRQILNELRPMIEKAVQKELADHIDAKIDEKLDDVVDEKIASAKHQITTDVARSQLALIKSSNADIKSQVRKDLAETINKEIAPKINNFMSNVGMHMADHTEMVTQYRRNVNDGHVQAAKDAVRGAHAMAAGRQYTGAKALPQPQQQQAQPKRDFNKIQFVLE